jgi:hypothetical protein
MKCKKCDNILFKIQVIPCCDDCEANDAYDPDEEEYIDDVKVIDLKELIRNHVSEQGECSFGSAFGAGCHVYICDKCNGKTNIAILDGC